MLNILDPKQSEDSKRFIIHDLSYNKGIQVFIFAEELRRLSKLHGYNLAAMFAQSWHETGGFTSEAWTRRKNPAGIKNKTGVEYVSVPNGVDSARLFVVHMSAYRPPLKNEDSLANYRYLDPRYIVAVYANMGKIYNTMDDLTGHWAEDKTYGTQIERVYHELYDTHGK